MHLKVGEASTVCDANPCLGMGFRQLVEPRRNVARHGLNIVTPGVDQKHIAFQGGCQIKLGPS
ncbi:hypothetical protein LJR231_001782 [Phyllobacterium sp. LjRoot231]|uniref:hypothetical protein n=1 Tax=Phyllobacterium sp. LjRoot231 TaxID=3342289 RepID=UPI003ECFDDBC